MIKYLFCLTSKDRVNNGKNLSRNCPQCYRVHSIEGVSPTLTSKSGGASGPGSNLFTVEEDGMNKISMKTKLLALASLSNVDRKKHKDDHSFLKKVKIKDFKNGTFIYTNHYGQNGTFYDEKICKTITKQRPPHIIVRDDQC